MSKVSCESDCNPDCMLWTIEQVVGPECNDDAALLRFPAVIDDLLDATIGADIDVPGIARRIAALGRVFHHHLLARSIPQRQLLHALIGHDRADVPDHRKDNNSQ
jgi:hypothetical protein